MPRINDTKQHQSNTKQTAQKEDLLGIIPVEIKTEQRKFLKVFQSIINFGMKIKQPTTIAVIAAINTAPAAMSLISFI